MSDTIDAEVSTLVTSPGSGDAGDVRPNGHVIPALDLLRIGHGLSFAFWGLFVMLLSLVQIVISGAPRKFEFFMLGSGVLGIVGAAWRLRQARGLSRVWRKRAEALFATGLAVAYLFPFFWMWRRLPLNIYLLAHALLFAGAVIYYATSISWVIAELAKIWRRRSLAIQAALVGAATLLMVLVPFLFLTKALINTAHSGVDPISMLQLELERTKLWIPLLALFPFSLTLSLLWAAKDIALHELTASAQTPRKL
jgi:hypothetical protein